MVLCYRAVREAQGARRDNSRSGDRENATEAVLEVVYGVSGNSFVCFRTGTLVSIGLIGGDFSIG